MKIAGLQKLTLLDFPERMACTVFTHGCNFRCPFCHNAPLVTQKLTDEISEDEFFSFLSSRKGILDGVCITGGEPTLQKDLPEFIGKIKAMGFLVKLDTNGYNPDMLRYLIENKLIDYVAMDIKNSKEKYSVTCGIDIDIARVCESVEILKDSDIAFEFRTTVVKQFHEEDDFLSISKWLKGESKYFLQQFRENENVIADGLCSLSEDEMKKAAEIISSCVPNVVLRGI